MYDVSPPIPKGQRNPPAGFRYSLGHTWVQLVSIDLALLGATEFAVSFAGRLAEVTPIRESKLLRTGETAWTFTSLKGRRLSQVSPIGGQVLAANSDILDDPALLQESPYETGWILCVRSPSIPHFMGKLLSQEPDLLCLERTCQCMTSVLGTALRLPFRDGGWRPCFGDEFNDEEWQTLCQEFFPSPPS
jgi:glycine cleavage system H protein